MADIIQIRRGLASQWTSTNPVLADGELGFETDTKKGKLGDAVTAWNSLPYSFTGDVPDNVATQITAATAKATPADADNFGITDSAASNVLKKLSWANIKTALNSLYAALSHAHSAADITSGILTVIRGGTGIGSYTANNYIRALNSTTLEQRTPAQVLSDVGAAASSHTHAASAITSGTFDNARIAQSNVTQHQAALSIASTQVTGTKTSAYISDFAAAALTAAPAETLTTVGALINSAADKANPVDADLVAIRNTTGGLLAKVTWANIKATLKTYFDTLYGYIGVPQNAQPNAYTLVLADAGKHIFHASADTTARTWTIPANSSVAFPIGTAITFVNQNAAGVITIAITSDTMRLAGAGTTGSRTLAANGVATALKITSTEWIISGSNLT